MAPENPAAPALLQPARNKGAFGHRQEHPPRFTALDDTFFSLGQEVTCAVLAAAATGVAYGVNKYRKYAQDKKMDRRIAESEASGAPGRDRPGADGELDRVDGTPARRRAAEIRPVEATGPFFRVAKAGGDQVVQEHEDLVVGGGHGADAG